MMLTRIIASALLAAAGFAAFGAGSAAAQSAREAATPAEFPPASFSGKQYVDSRGCVFIRAGIDGNVTWIPRVTRSRKQLCGFQPTQIAADDAAPKAVIPPTAELITLPKGQRANDPVVADGANVAPSEPVPTPTAPRVVTTTKPQREPARVAKPIPVRTAKASLRRPRPAYNDAYRRDDVPLTILTPNWSSGSCQGASELSRQYINRGSGVRCGPQDGFAGGYGALDANTRVMPKHVYEERQLSRGLSVPDGYRKVWEDDRLNPRRAEMSLRQLETQSGRQAVVVENGDAASGASGQIWTRSVPRQGIKQPVNRPVVRLSESRESAGDQDQLVTRLSTRSSPEDGQAPVVEQQKYVRAATVSDRAKAETVAQSLRKHGLPVRLGKVERAGVTHQVVLAGPFAGPAAAEAALAKVRAAGYAGARISR